MKTTMNFGEALREYRENKGWTQEKLSEESGVDQATISAIEVRKSGRSRYSAQLARALGTTVEEMIFGADDLSAASLEVNRVYVAKVDGARLSAGSGEVIYDFEELDASHSFQREWMKKKGLDPKRCKLWEVRGDSMYPTFPDGSTVLINLAQRDPVSGKVFALITDDGLRLKRLHKRADGVWEIRSDNTEKNLYPTEVMTPGAVAILGRLRWAAQEVD